MYTVLLMVVSIFYSFFRMCVLYFPATTLDVFLIPTAYTVVYWVKEAMEASYGTSLGSITLP